MLLLQCLEQSDGEDNASDSETGARVAGSGQHVASMTATVVTTSHALSSRSNDCVPKAASHRDADGILRTPGGTAAELSSPLSSTRSDQHKAEISKKKLLQRGRVRTTRCHKCINCLAPDCGKCYSCRSVNCHCLC